MPRVTWLVPLLALLFVPALPAQNKKPDKEYAEVWVDLGFKHIQNGRLAKAEECYKKALEYDPDFAQAHANLTVVYLRTKRWPQLADSANAAIRLGTKITGVYLNRAEARRRLAADEKDPKKQKEYYQQAISDCDKVIDHKAQNLELSTKQDVAYAHAVASVCYRALGEQTLAEKHRDRAIELEPKLKDQ